MPKKPRNTFHKSHESQPSLKPSQPSPNQSSIKQKVEEWREVDTRLVVSLGLATRVLKATENLNPHRREEIPRETASFLILRVLNGDSEELRFDIYSQPYSTSKTSRTFGEGYYLPLEGASPIPDILDDVSLEALQQIAAQRPLLTDSAMFCTH